MGKKKKDRIATEERLASQIEALKEAMVALEAAEEKVRTQRERILGAMTVLDITRAESWGLTVQRLKKCVTHRFNPSLFAADHPDLFEKYVSEVKVDERIRVLRK